MVKLSIEPLQGIEQTGIEQSTTSLLLSNMGAKTSSILCVDCLYPVPEESRAIALMTLSTNLCRSFWERFCDHVFTTRGKRATDWKPYII